jgi:hypothetical protein
MKSIFDYNGKESSKAIQDGDDSDLYDAVSPTLDIFSGLFDIRFSVMAGAARVGFSAFGASAHDCFLIIIEKVGCLVVFRNNEDAAKGP